jgi:hypothetical protein
MKDKVIMGLVENIELFLGKAGFAKSDLYETSYLKKFLPVCHELYDTGTFDESCVDPSSLYDFAIGVLYVARAESIYQQCDFDQRYTSIAPSLFAAIGYMELEYPECTMGLQGWEYENAMAALARMKLSSFRAALSTSGRNINDIDSVVNFIKTRRGYIPLTVVNREAQKENITFSYHDQSLKIVARNLLYRAKWRDISVDKMMSVLNVDDKSELIVALIKADNSPTVAAMLSLDLFSFISLLHTIELEEAKQSLTNKYSKAIKAEVLVTAEDLKDANERVTPNEFIELLGAKVHPSYRANKKMKGYLLDDGREVAIELTTTKTVNVWINHSCLTSKFEDYLKNTIPETTPESKPYGRHSALRVYPSLAWEPISQLVVKNVGEATALANFLLAKA